MKPSGPRLLFIVSFKITDSISLLVIDLFIFSIFPGSVLRDCAFLKICLLLLGWGFSDTSVGKEATCSAGDTSLMPGSGRSPCRRDRLPTPVFLGSPCDLAGKESACNVGGLGSIPGLGRSHGEEKG